MIIDATNQLLGRLASNAAKQALLGKDVVILNCEKAVISGDEKTLKARYLQLYKRGTHSTGPFFPRMPDRIVRRTIRGMIPWKQERGRTAFDRVKCYLGIPAEYQNQKLTVLENTDASKLPNMNYVTIARISKLIGGRT